MIKPILFDLLLLLLIAVPSVAAFAPRPSSSSDLRTPTTSSLHYKDDGKLDADDDPMEVEEVASVAMNVLGTALRPCCGQGGAYCSMSHQEETVCCQVTEKFLEYAKETGKDLTVDLEDGTPGLRPGNIACITVDEWADAYNEGVAPYLWLEATHSKTLKHVPLDFLQVFAIDLEEANDRVDQLNEDRARLDRLI